jgi:hypothetical protein
MKKFLIIAFLLVISLTASYAQTFQWAHSLGLANRGRALAIANDSSGNLYTLGVDKTYNQPIMGQFQTGNLLLEKRNLNGDLQWANHFPGHACGLDIAVTANGNILITGAFYDSLYFGAGDTLHSPGLTDRMFLASFSPDGMLNWEKADTSQWGAIGTSITIAGPSHFFISGITQDIQGRLRKYDMQGEVLWEKEFPGVRTVDNCVIDQSGNLYISGTCNPYATFDELAIHPDTALAGYISYIAKLDADGKTVWLHANTYVTFDISTTLAFDNFGFLCRVRNSKDFQHTIFDVIEPTLDTVMATWQFPSSSGNFDRLITNSLTSTGSGQSFFGPYYASIHFDTTVIYELRHGLTGEGIIFFMDTLTVIRGRGMRIEALSLIDRTLYMTGYFNDSVLHLGSIELANTNDFAKFHTDPFIAKLTIDGGSASVSQHRDDRESLSLYPNPCSDEVTLAFGNSGTRLIEIYNVTGSLVKQVTSDAATEVIHLQHQPPGVYTAMVRDNTGKIETAVFVVAGSQ